MLAKNRLREHPRALSLAAQAQAPANHRHRARAEAADVSAAETDHASEESMSAAEKKDPTMSERIAALDPLSRKVLSKEGDVFARYLQELVVERKWKVRDAVVQVLKASGMYELVCAKGSGAVDRIVAHYEREMLRREKALDEGNKFIRGVAIEKVDADPEDVASGKAFEEQEGGLVKLA